MGEIGYGNAAYRERFYAFRAERKSKILPCRSEFDGFESEFRAAGALKVFVEIVRGGNGRISV